MANRTRWRPYRFSLATLLIFMTLAAFGSLWLRNYAFRPRLEAKLVEQLQTRHGSGVSIAYQLAASAGDDKIGPVWWFTEQTPVLAIEIREDVHELDSRLFSRFSELKQAKILGPLSHLDRQRWERSESAYSEVPWARSQSVRPGPSLLNDKQWRNLLEHRQLRVLAIENQSLSAKELECLSRNHSIRHLSIINGRLDESDLAMLSKMTWLETLALRRNQFDGRAFGKTAVQFRALRYLDLQQCPLHDDALIGIGAMPTLVTLDVSHTSIRDDGVRHLAKSRSLVDLRLVDTFVSYRVGNELAAMPTLKIINLVRTGFDLEQLADFQARAPHLTVTGYMARTSNLFGPRVATTSGTGVPSQLAPAAPAAISALPASTESEVELPPSPSLPDTALRRDF